ncbi:DNA-binding protein (plasmid) [Klebsiella quasipneumoniae]|uniref:DNA-binding protein n=1 Tax=Klebsiella quasipneumoniae TaxID=1463165 RepID=UPI0019159C55|nr:DNA-binding protein [Klebsiella quasipneumoniae]QQM83428.1 DNA-binding protein [Klebsiella quasipneumoniae]
MRPAEFSPEEIVAAGEALVAAGRNVTGFALRQKVGGGNPNRLKQVWDEHLAAKNTTEAEPVAELPVEVAEEVAAVTKSLTERLATLAVELNDKAVKAAERRVAEVLRTAGEQREQAERELVDAAQTVDELETRLDQSQAEVESLERRLSEAQSHGQAQAVELAQLRERLVATEQAARATADAHEAVRSELDAARRDAGVKIEALRDELAQLRERLAASEQAAKVAAETHARELEQAHSETKTVRAELDAARREASEKIEALRGELAEQRPKPLLMLRHTPITGRGWSRMQRGLPSCWGRQKRLRRLPGMMRQKPVNLLQSWRVSWRLYRLRMPLYLLLSSRGLIAVRVANESRMCVG